MKREVNKIIFRCNDSDVMKLNDQSRNKGYHYFIQKNGSVQGGIPVTKEGDHTENHNEDSIGICLHGRKELANDQFRSLRNLIKTLARKFKLKKAFLIGDTDNFDVKRFIKNYLPEFAKEGIGTFESIDPAAAGSKEGSKPGSEKGSEKGSEPGSKSGSKSGSKPAAGSKPGSEKGSEPGSKEVTGSVKVASESKAAEQD